MAACRDESTSPTAFRPDAGLSAATRSDSIPGAYIVLLREDATNVDAFATQTVRTLGGRREQVFEHVVKGFSVRDLPDVALQALRSNPAVELVEPVRVLYPDAVQTLPLDSPFGFQFSSRWGLDRIDEQGPALFDGVYNYDYSGAGVHVYIVDSGIKWQHVQFAGREGLSYGSWATPQGFVGPWNDDIGHGTAVAGIAVGSTYGIAKNAIIHSVRHDVGAPGAECDVTVNRLDWIVATLSARLSST